MARSSSLSLFLLSIIPFLLLPRREELSLSDPSDLKFQGVEEDRYIVRFKVYKPSHEHRADLEHNLGGEGDWEWIDRNNPAKAFPTDFALLSFPSKKFAQISQRILSFDFVKDVFPEARYSRGLLSEDSEVIRKPGKLFTRMSCEIDEENNLNSSSFGFGRRLSMERSQITSMFGADNLWSKGYTGSKIKMAIFDTGIRSDHPHFRNIKERTNWTNEDTLNDNLGHGTFVAGVVASQNSQCLGFSPDAEIYAFRVFTDAQVSYTSWFLDAFNYAIATGMNVLNLSIGGPDYLDRPFVEKVWEVTANKIIMVSAIGNDGPLYGTLNNPADQSDVIGIGGIDYNDHIASFSSRGMTTWEIPHGYGRVKPDIVAYGRDIMGSKISTGCKSLSGTSVASPVVAGIVCLLASVIPENIRWDILNPASMKQVLVEGAARLGGPNMFEQGAGRIDLLESYEILSKYKPRASIFPSVVDFTDCPYSWPFCRQPLYAGSMPVIFNATILNGMGVIGYVDSEPKWQPSSEDGSLLSIHFTYSDIIWPWTGFLALHMQVKKEGFHFSGIIEGNVSFTVTSPPAKGEKELQKSLCVLSLRVQVIPTPPRTQRILWDQFHNIRYPPGYIPRDSLEVRSDILDWHGDHPHTNFHGMFDMLRDAGYFVEILGSPLTCFDASQYGTLLMVDLEDEYYKEEIEKLENDIRVYGLGLIVFADWYNVDTMLKMKFFDDNTRSWWTPVTGGANIPALNDLLKPFGIAFGDTILNGAFTIGEERCHYASGTDIAVFPKGGFVHRFSSEENSYSKAAHNLLSATGLSKEQSAVLGILELTDSRGRIAVYGDSNCLDSSHMVVNCYWLLKKLLDFTSKNIQDSVIFAPSSKIELPLHKKGELLPRRRDDVNISSYSSVLSHELACKNDARFEIWGAKSFHRHNLWKTRKLPGIATTSYQNASLGQKSPDFISIDEMANAKLNPNNTIFTMTPEKEKKVSNSEAYKGGSEQSFLLTRNKTTITSSRRHYPTMDFLGWLGREELDVPTFVEVQWLVPVLLCITGFFLGLSFWRARQKRRRRGRKVPLRSISIL